MTTTLQLLIGTAAISILANHFSRLKESMLFKPVRIKNNQEWYRFFTSGFIHADWEHLLFNLFSLYLFGTLVENAYQSESLFGSNGNSMYLIMYFSSIPFSLLYSYVKYRSKSNYASLGASGAGCLGSCGYQKQFGDKKAEEAAEAEVPEFNKVFSEVKVMAHNHLFLNTKGRMRKPKLVIIDEAFW